MTFGRLPAHLPIREMEIKDHPVIELRGAELDWVFYSSTWNYTRDASPIDNSSNEEMKYVNARCVTIISYV